MAGSSVTGIGVKLAVPIALIATGLWAVDRYLSLEAAKKVGSFLLIFIVILIVVWLLIWVLRKLFISISAAGERRQMARAEASPEGASPQRQAEIEGLQRS